jgi:hypothetical protein
MSSEEDRWHDNSSSLDESLLRNLKGLSNIVVVDGREGDEEKGWFQRAPGLKNIWSSGLGSSATPGGSNGDGTVLEIGLFNTHAEFTLGRPNGYLRPAAITCILVGSAFHTTDKCNPNTTVASIVQPSVLEVSSASLIPFQTSMSIQPTVEVSYHRFCMLRQ